MFGSVELIGTVKNKYAREYGARVYMCRSPKPEFFDFYQQKVKEALQEVRRNWRS